ncbi:MAG: Xaa-Pro aminopeptidase [Lysobacterales bacterium]|jgi:Xaa-Pro aminopeptidase|nr:MAG: Xaa-Pro aminopeptidase [Xanthomonadales bacterium]
MSVRSTLLSEYQRRRRVLMRTCGEASAIVVPAAHEKVRSNDTHYPFRQDSDFLYLTGFREPDAVLVLVPGRARGEAVIFCRERDAERERWDGPRLGVEAAAASLGLDDAFPLADIDEILPGLIEGRSKIYYPLGRDPDFDRRILAWLERLRSRSRQGATPPQELVALSHVLAEQRLFKSPAEVALMRKAVAIAVAAHRRAMASARPGIREYELEAELLYEFKREGAEPAYGAIVASGPNACILHHRAGSRAAKPGELVLIDAGAEFEGYASDITRTFPVDGRFSAPQRALYELVLAAQEAAIAAVRPGASWIAPHQAAVRVLTEGLVRLGLLDGAPEKHIREESYRRFYMHKTGHWLGLDVHDVGDYRVDGEWRVLEPGMVLTIEPGLYIAEDDTTVAPEWRGIGIRIEDDVLVTRRGAEVLSAALPKAPEAIEAMVGCAAKGAPNPLNAKRPAARKRRG